MKTRRNENTGLNGLRGIFPCVSFDPESIGTINTAVCFYDVIISVLIRRDEESRIASACTVHDVSIVLYNMVVQLCHVTHSSRMSYKVRSELLPRSTSD